MVESIAYFLDREKQLLFYGETSSLIGNSETSVAELESYIQKQSGKYIAVALSYDLKNKFENLTSSNSDRIDFPLFCLWTPKHVFKKKDSENWRVLFTEDEACVNEDLQCISQKLNNNNENIPKITFESSQTKEEYLKSLEQVLAEIQQGNTYDLNYCQEFFAENVPDFSSFQLVRNQFEMTQSPFSVYLNFRDWEVFCGSPERYIKREKNRLFSQPIKGTIAKGNTIEEDNSQREKLRSSIKDQTENVMIVDLVRNDLSRIATKGSVQVDELFGIYSFPTVHHMISTVSCEVTPETSFVKILEATFPMGSMTGAPKISTMKICEELEKFKRGIYAGSIGYIEPNGDFDLNVVIRSLVLNKKTRVMTSGVGGAITINSDPESEYEECRVKIKKTLQLFGPQDAI